MSFNWFVSGSKGYELQQLRVMTIWDGLFCELVLEGSPSLKV